SKPQRLALRRLHEVPVQARKAVILACLTDLPMHAIGQQIGETEAESERLLGVGLASLRTSLGLPDDATVTMRLRELESSARAAAQPVSADLRAQGVRRRRLRLAAGCVAAVVLTVLAGTFVRVQPVKPVVLPPPLGPAVQRSMLLGTDGLQSLGNPLRWTVDSTSDNTTGNGINSFCQAARFADPQGLRTYVRRFQFTGRPTRTASQTIELSRTVRQARAGYATALKWFAGCQQARVQLLTSYGVDRLGDEGAILKFRATGKTLRSYAVALARTGHITTWTAITTMGSRNPETGKLLESITGAVRRVCASRVAGTCPLTPVVTENAPPPSGEQEGMLAVADLPPIGTIAKPWVGTRAGPATDNPAATTCDRADFVAAGASRSLSRTFLIPGANTPARFGLSETWGRFGSTTQAKAFMQQVRGRMDGCEKKDPGAKVSDRAEQLRGPRGSVWTMWRLESDISDKRTIAYWMGIARVGPNVAQVGFVPGDTFDVDAAAFRALVVRARDRLFELPVETPTTQAQRTPAG
ncbi:MAG: hypothetical protein QOI78_2065, partial [Actinomycetota bacterium]|nr:hypothetical protein [Actinomycetota bacterium]